jgi:hypothetical protein
MLLILTLPIFSIADRSALRSFYRTVAGEHKVRAFSAP